MAKRPVRMIQNLPLRTSFLHCRKMTHNKAPVHTTKPNHLPAMVIPVLIDTKKTMLKITKQPMAMPTSFIASKAHFRSRVESVECDGVAEFIRGGTVKYYSDVGRLR